MSHNSIFGTQNIHNCDYFIYFDKHKRRGGVLVSKIYDVSCYHYKKRCRKASLDFLISDYVS